VNTNPPHSVARSRQSVSRDASTIGSTRLLSIDNAERTHGGDVVVSAGGGVYVIKRNGSRPAHFLHSSRALSPLRIRARGAVRPRERRLEILLDFQTLLRRDDARGGGV